MQHHNFIFIFLHTALLDAAKPNHVSGLATATDTVIISCDLSKRIYTMDKFEIIHIMKWHYDQRKTNFLFFYF